MINYFSFFTDHPLATLIIGGLALVVTFLIYKLLKKDMSLVKKDMDIIRSDFSELATKVDSKFGLMQKDQSQLITKVDSKFGLMQKDQSHIKELFTNHVTETREDIKEIKSDVKEIKNKK